MTEPSAVLYCPHCGNTSVQTLLRTHEYRQPIYEVESGREVLQPSTYHLTKCETCNDLLLYSYCELFGNDEAAGPYGSLAYPAQIGWGHAIPDRVRRFYLEALRVKSASPTAFTILARRVLEEIVRERGGSSGTLAKGLENLAKTGLLPPFLAEASTLIRLVGNIGAHADDIEVTPHQAWTVEHFLKAVLEYVYVAPYRIEEFKKSMSRFSTREDA